MNRSLKLGVSVADVEKMISAVQEQRKWLESRTAVFLQRLAQMGATNASLRFSRAIYSGVRDAKVTVKKIKNGYLVKADGESVLFIEFGSGVTYGHGHPEATEYGMGPGTYPNGKGHWDDPKGWWIPKDKGGGHTFGNSPAMPMYETIKDLKRSLPQLVKEVFR